MAAIVFLVSTVAQGRRQPPASLDQRLCSFRDAKLTLRLNSVFATVALEAFVFWQPRDGRQHIYVSLQDVYKVLQLRSYKGMAAKWICESASQWTNMWAKSITGEHIICHAISVHSSR